MFSIYKNRLDKIQSVSCINLFLSSFSICYFYFIFIHCIM
nr:MAG TPA: hypothetical protein [Caudoviricetes sp.]